ncbi:MAG TPA: HEPN domain-containing protein [Phycisphaerae bacterium]|nr:HEPN domain-containing protein [Phycisphaerae bacterium]
MRAFAAAEWDRAGRALGSARQLVETDPDSAASRAYYAAFHALTALFALREQTFTRHSAIRAALHRDLVQPGELPEEHGRDYDFLTDVRETGDYGGLTQVPAETARLAVEKAEAFVAAIERMCPDLAG